VHSTNVRHMSATWWRVHRRRRQCAQGRCCLYWPRARRSDPAGRKRRPSRPRSQLQLGGFRSLVLGPAASRVSGQRLAANIGRSGGGRARGGRRPGQDGELRGQEPAKHETRQAMRCSLVQRPRAGFALRLRSSRRSPSLAKSSKEQHHTTHNSHTTHNQQYK
jgi:hypothetical protein